AVDGVTAAAAVVRYRLDRRRAASPPEAALAPSPPIVRSPQRPRRPPAEASGGDLVFAPDDPETLQAALLSAARLAPHRGTTFLLPGGEADRQSYADLLGDAGRLLAGLRARDVAPGDAVVFQFDANRNLVTSFWACLLGGFVATPVGTAPSYARNNATTRKLRSAWELLGRPLILTESGLRQEVARLGDLWGEREL